VFDVCRQSIAGSNFSAKLGPLPIEQRGSIERDDTMAGRGLFAESSTLGDGDADQKVRARRQPKLAAQIARSSAFASRRKISCVILDDVSIIVGLVQQQYEIRCELFFLPS
jgi:hypothetical protein